MAIQQNPYSITDRFGRVIANNAIIPGQGDQKFKSFIQDLVSKGYDLSGASLTGGPVAGGYAGPLSKYSYLSPIIGQSTAPPISPITGQPTGPDISTPFPGTPPTGISPNGGGPITPDQNIQPLPNIPGLSNPETPVNTSTVPGVDISPYIPATSQQQQDIVNNAITQSQGVASQNVKSLQDILGPYIQSQVQNWTDPNSPDYQATMGALNNVGRADAGTFGQSLSSRLAPLISQGAYQLGTGALLPSFLNQQDLVSRGAGAQSTLGLEPLNRFVELQNWGMQKDLANQLAQQGASAQFGSGIGGLLGGGLGAGLGGLAGGVPGALIGAQLGNSGGSAAGGGTWICTHLKKLKLATEEEVEAVHDRLYPSIFRHPVSWLHYLYCAPSLIVLADEAGLDWKEVKPVLIDAVLAERDSEKAWQIYRAECQRLTLKYAPQLWTLEVLPC